MQQRAHVAQRRGTARDPSGGRPEGLRWLNDFVQRRKERSVRYLRQVFPVRHPFDRRTLKGNFPHDANGKKSRKPGSLVRAGQGDQAAALAPDKLASLTMSGFWGNIIPVTLGNMAGGILFVAILYYLVFSGALSHENQ